MENLFLAVVNMSITAFYVIVAVLLIRLFMRKAPKKYSYLLWSVVGFRLVCPVSFRSAFSIFGLKIFDLTRTQNAKTAAIRYIPQNVGMTAAPEMTSGLSSASGAVGAIPLPAPESPVQSANPMQIILAICVLIWCAGIAVLLLYGAVSYARVGRRMRTAVRLEGNVYQSDQVRSPFILGFLSPRIYIPFGLDERTQRYVLLHERYHLKRRDHIIKLIAFLILTLHWFNPLCWVSFILMGKDMEMSCDEKVLGEGQNIRKLYGTALLSFAANRRFPAPGPLAFGESSVKARIKNVLGWKKPGPAITAIAAVVCCAVLAACAANPENAEAEGLSETGNMSETAETAETSGETGTPAEVGTADPESGESGNFNADEHAGAGDAPENEETLEAGEAPETEEAVLQQAPKAIGSITVWNLNGSESVSIDVDGDGTEEQISIIPENPATLNGNYFEGSYTLRVDSRELKEYADNPERTIIVFSPDGQQTLLGIYDEGPSADPITRFYRYDSSGLHEAGTIPEDIRRLQIDENGVIKCPYRVDIIQTAFVWSYWYWDKNAIVMHQDEEYEFIQNENAEIPVTLLENLPVHSQCDEAAETDTMLPQKVKLLKTDLKEWVYISAEDGTEGWLRVDVYTIPSLGDKESREVFDGLNFFG